MRLFIGIPVPPDIQRQLTDAWRSVRTYPTPDKPIKSSLWHVTLAFLDDVHPDQLEMLKEYTEKAVKHPPQGGWTISGFQSYPTRNPMRIVTQITPANPMQWRMFVDGLRDLVSIVVPRIDRKPWSPHISIIRKEKGLHLETWEEKIAPIEWTPKELAIIQSTPGPEGSVYTNLHVFRLE